MESCLAEQKGLAMEEVDGGTLKQSISAVQGQMQDFVSLMEASILPNHCALHSQIS